MGVLDVVPATGRPDLLADVAKLRATDAGIAAARSALAPKVSLSANVQGNIGRLNVNNSPCYEAQKSSWLQRLS